MMETFTARFPLWAMLLALIAYILPDYFIGLKAGIIPLLVIIMFGMGMTLTAADFKQVWLRPKTIALGVLLQYLLMPLAAWLIALALRLPTELMIGMVLVGSSAGGTASNVICYLARGNVALSITLTLCSTLLAIVAMPALTLLYAGQSITVPAGSMLLSILKIVLLPVLLGVGLNTLFHKQLRPLTPFFPAVSSLAIILIIAIIIALNRDNIASMGTSVLVAVILHNLFGLASTYGIARGLRYDETTARTLAIEVGMQNSGLSVALAIKYFSTTAALPGALFSIWHNLSGSILASWWRRHDRQ